MWLKRKHGTRSRRSPVTPRAITPRKSERNTRWTTSVCVCGVALAGWRVLPCPEQNRRAPLMLRSCSPRRCPLHSQNTNTYERNSPLHKYRDPSARSHNVNCSKNERRGSVREIDLRSTVGIRRRRSQSITLTFRRRRRLTQTGRSAFIVNSTFTAQLRCAELGDLCEDIRSWRAARARARHEG